MTAISNKFKAHTVYKTASGIRVPGVTTITAELGWSKETLCKWHNRMGREGIDTSKYVTDKADIGTLAHRMVECYLTGETLDTSDYSKNQIDTAENCLISFYEWEKSNAIKVIHHELQLVSETYGFGGTLDLYGIVNLVYEISDLKTGSGIYPEHFVQVGGYCILADEHNIPYQRARIINIPRNEDEEFSQKIIPNLEVAKQIFLKCLDIYKLKSQLKKGGE